MDFKALVVDDDEVCLLIHKQIISISGFHDSPLAFSSAEIALTYLKKLSADDGPVILFLDINMPGMNGWEMLDVLHGEPFQTQISVAIVSSSIDDRDKNKADTYSKVIDFIEKPFSITSIEKLKDKIRQLQ